MFIEALSLLNDEQKAIVRKLGFGSLLDFSCSGNLNDIIFWLLNYFDATNTTVTFENGFSFTITPQIVHKILGIPSGSNNVRLKVSKEATACIEKIVQIESPSVEDLCSMLSNQLDDTTFSIIFMLLNLSSFIAPDGSGCANPCYYENLINVLQIPELDWCSFTLNWLLVNIKKYQRGLLECCPAEMGGCKIILAVRQLSFYSLSFHVFLIIQLPD